MIEVYLILTGIIFFAWLYALVRQTQRSAQGDQTAPPRPIVPVNLMDTDEAIVVSEGRGRIVYVNGPARLWFGMDGGAPNLATIVRRHPARRHAARAAGQPGTRLAAPGSAPHRSGLSRYPRRGRPAMILVMRELGVTAAPAFSDFDPLRALAILSDISQAVGSRLDLESTIDATLRSIEQSITFNSAEVTLWYPEIADAAAGRAQCGTHANRPPDADRAAINRIVTGWAKVTLVGSRIYRQPLLVGDVGARTDVVPKAYRGDFQSYLGVPLLVGDQFVGTIELMHRERHAFSQRDIALLGAVTGQIASAVQAARLYREQVRQLDELEGLQQIAAAMSALGSPHALYAQVTQRVAQLLGVEICGVLLYDENTQVFRSQPPFFGVADTLISRIT